MAAGGGQDDRHVPDVSQVPDVQKDTRGARYGRRDGQGRCQGSPDVRLYAMLPQGGGCIRARGPHGWCAIVQDYMETALLEREARIEVAEARRMAAVLCRTGAGMEPAARRELANAARSHAGRALELSAQCRDGLEMCAFTVQSHYYGILDSIDHTVSRAKDAVVRVDECMEGFGGEDAV